MRLIPALARLTLAFLFTFLSLLPLADGAYSQSAPKPEAAIIRIHNLFADAEGETHFRDIEIALVGQRQFTKYSERLPATAIIFSETSGDYDLDWHPAPRRQYIIILAGAMQITASDGEKRIIGADEVILVEDIKGKGHLSRPWPARCCARSPCRSISVALTSARCSEWIPCCRLQSGNGAKAG
jgi:hypothetical protein